MEEVGGEEETSKERLLISSALWKRPTVRVRGSEFCPKIRPPEMSWLRLVSSSSTSVKPTPRACKRSKSIFTLTSSCTPPETSTPATPDTTLSSRASSSSANTRKSTPSNEGEVKANS